MQIDKRILSSSPYVERTILVEDNRAIVRFSIINQPAISAEFYKDYDLHFYALQMVYYFLQFNHELPTLKQSAPPDFKATHQEIADFISQLINNEFELPDVDFIFEGEFQRLYQLLEQIL